MALTSYGVNSPETNKVWRKQLFEEALAATTIGKFMGEGSGSVLQELDDLRKTAGDRITVTLRMQLTGDGVLGDATLEGNEEALVTYTDNLFIDQLRNAVRSGGKMSDQRILWKVRDEAMQGLADWYANRWDTAFYNQMAGATYQTDLKYTGNNAVIAASSGRVYRDGAANDESLTTGNEFDLSFIDQAVSIAKTVNPIIRPVKINGEDHYCCVLHPWQVRQMRTNTSTGQWLDIQKAATTGDGSSSNPIFTGALGVYNGAILYEDRRIPYGVNSSTGAAVTNARRAVFMGAQAGVMAFGRDNSADRMDWNEELFDYGNQLGISVGSIFGMKKTQFNSTDFGTIVLASYTPS